MLPMWKEEITTVGYYNRDGCCVKSQRCVNCLKVNIFRDEIFDNFSSDEESDDDI